LSNKKSFMLGTSIMSGVVTHELSGL